DSTGHCTTPKDWVMKNPLIGAVPHKDGSDLEGASTVPPVSPLGSAAGFSPHFFTSCDGSMALLNENGTLGIIPPSVPLIDLNRRVAYNVLDGMGEAGIVSDSKTQPEPHATIDVDSDCPVLGPRLEESNEPPTLIDVDFDYHVFGLQLEESYPPMMHTKEPLQCTDHSHPTMKDTLDVDLVKEEVFEQSFEETRLKSEE
ncbi:hypothetical protein KI387_027551, partial [Taxus chinensis]